MIEEQSQLESNIEKLQTIISILDKVIIDLDENGRAGNYNMIQESIRLRAEAALKLARLMMREVDN